MHSPGSNMNAIKTVPTMYHDIGSPREPRSLQSK